MSVTLLAASAASLNWATVSPMNVRRRDVTVITECAIIVGLRFSRRRSKAMKKRTGD